MDIMILMEQGYHLKLSIHTYIARFLLRIYNYQPHVRLEAVNTGGFH
jgi:hypothetical protein